MALSSKRFVLVSNQVNGYGYRVDTAHMDIKQFTRNPTMLYMHERGNVIGHWQDIKREDNGDITAVPFFTEASDKAKQLAAMVEDGSYRMCSVGFQALATSDEPELLMPGQKYETVTKSKLVEASIVDVGADDNALCLYNKTGLLLLDGSNDTGAIIPIINLNSKTEMKQELIPMLMLVGLKQDGTIEQLMAKISELKSNAETATSKLQLKEDAIVKLNETIATLEQAASSSAVVALLDAAVAARKITAEQMPFYKQMGESNIDNLKQLLDTMPAMPTLQSQVAGGAAGADALLALSYEDAHKSGKLAEIKTKHPDHYKQIFKTKFGKEPSA
jgi:HK97 family phage prohead protease